MTWPVRKHRPRRVVIDSSRKLVPQLMTAAKAQVLVAECHPSCHCGRPARLVVLAHQLDNCQRQLGQLDITPDGNQVYLMCLDCARAMHSATAAALEHRVHNLPEGSELACGGCHRRITSLHDVLEVEEL